MHRRYLCLHFLPYNSERLKVTFYVTAWPLIDILLRQDRAKFESSFHHIFLFPWDVTRQEQPLCYGRTLGWGSMLVWCWVLRKYRGSWTVRAPDVNFYLFYGLVYRQGQSLQALTTWCWCWDYKDSHRRDDTNYATVLKAFFCFQGIADSRWLHHTPFALGLLLVSF